MSLFAFLLCTQTKPDIRPSWDLLTKPDVQRELRLSPVQIKQVSSILKSADAEYDRRRKKDPQMNREAISHYGAVMRIAITDLDKFGMALSVEQQRRAREISLQRLGPRLLFYPGLAEELELTPEARERIDADQSKVSDDYWQKINDYAKVHHVKMVTMKGGFKVPMETPAIRHLQKESDEALWAALRADLTKEQNDRLRKLLGRPFGS
jgi:hypothetical protein